MTNTATKDFDERGFLYIKGFLSKETVEILSEQIKIHYISRKWTQDDPHLQDSKPEYQDINYSVYGHPLSEGLLTYFAPIVSEYIGEETLEPAYSDWFLMNNKSKVSKHFGTKEDVIVFIKLHDKEPDKPSFVLQEKQGKHISEVMYHDIDILLEPGDALILDSKQVERFIRSPLEDNKMIFVSLAYHKEESIKLNPQKLFAYRPYLGLPKNVI